MERSVNEKAEQKKQLGNNEFKKGNYTAAINYYTDALGKFKTTQLIMFRNLTSRSNLLKSRRQFHRTQRLQTGTRRLSSWYSTQLNVSKNLQKTFQGPHFTRKHS
jgi:hypothetical protein